VAVNSSGSVPAATRLLSPGRRWSLLAILFVVVASGWLLQGGTDNEKAHYALVRALAHGTIVVDETRFQTGDWTTIDVISWDGHQYSNKPPGLAFLCLPPYLAFRALGISDSGDPRRMLWALGLFGTVLPAAGLALLIRRIANRIEPGTGTLVAVTLALGTLVLPFATVMHSHLLSAFLVFAAFALLWRERESATRLWLVALGGLVAGLAVTTDYPNGIAAVGFGLYAISRAPRLRRGVAYAAGFLAGVAPLLVYQYAIFGSPLQVTYAGESPRSGERTTNELASYFGPSGRVLLETLFSMNGLFMTTPVLACGAVATDLLFRRGLRAEALAIAGVSAAVIVYNSSYGKEFDVYPAGERYLIVIMPLLALPLAISFRRFPATTGGLALVSGVLMLALTSSHVRTGIDPRWFHELAERRVPPTVLSFLGITGWYAVLPFFVAAALAVGCAIASASGVRASPGETAFGAFAVLGWALAASAAPNLYAPGYGAPGDFVGVGLAAGLLVAVAVAAAVWARNGRARPGVLRPDRAPG
jgi:hypothetical protein